MLFKEVILLESEAHSLFPRVRLLQLLDAMPRVEDRWKWIYIYHMRCSPIEKGREIMRKRKRGKDERAAWRIEREER